MEYPKITALVPAGEHFDSSAINEGVYLTTSHINAIETSLANNATEVTSITGKLNAEVLRAQGAEASLATANQTIIDRDAAIVAKDAEIAKLKAGPAGEMASTGKAKDDLGAGDAVVESETTKQARELRELRDGKKKS